MRGFRPGWLHSELFPPKAYVLQTQFLPKMYFWYKNTHFSPFWFISSLNQSLSSLINEKTPFLALFGEIVPPWVSTSSQPGQQASAINGKITQWHTCLHILICDCSPMVINMAEWLYGLRGEKWNRTGCGYPLYCSDNYSGAEEMLRNATTMASCTEQLCQACQAIYAKPTSKSMSSWIPM